MGKKSFVVPAAPAPAAHYSHGVVVDKHMYVSGQGPIDADSDEVVGRTIQEQVAKTLDNVATILNAGGFSLADVVQVRVFLSDLAHYSGLNEAYRQYFQQVPHPPVRTTVVVGLPREMMVEIDVIAQKASD